MCSVIALSKLYTLNDQRLVQTMVKGDLIIPTSDRIRTRSQSKNSTAHCSYRFLFQGLTSSDPDQFTVIPAPLKIIKVLIEELLSASGAQMAAAQAAAAAEFGDEEGDDDGWEDLPSTLDLGLGSTKAELMAWGEGQGSFVRQRDDETQAYLTEFFVKASRENVAGFNELYGALTEEEKVKLNEIASQ
jgi:hypothetical protein